MVEKSAGQLENLIGSAQFLVLSLQGFDALALFSRHAVTLTAILGLFGAYTVCFSVKGFVGFTGYSR
jgi:hypothetical protein